MPSWKDIQEQLAVITRAPAPFIAVTIVIAGIVWLIESWAFSSIIASKDATISSVSISKDATISSKEAVISDKDATIATLNERIKFKDDQLQNKFNSTPPDEAKSIIKDLQARIEKMSPRRLSETQISKIKGGLSAVAGKMYSLEIMADVACGDCRKFAEQFSDLFSSSGWRVFPIGTVMGPSVTPRSGLALLARDPSSLTDAEKSLAVSFADAKLNPLISKGGGHPGGADVELLITAGNED